LGPFLVSSAATEERPLLLIMRHYESPGSRVAFAVVAVTMAAATIGLLVLLPAKLDSQQPVVLTASAQDATVGMAP
jgi:hypothetical protein